MTEYLIVVAEAGVSGVGVQGGLAACRGYTPLCVPGASAGAPGTAPGIDSVADTSLGAAVPTDGRLTAQPDFYALLLVHELEGGRWIAVTGAPAGRVYAAGLLMPDGRVCVVVVNTAGATAVDLRIPGVARAGRARVQWLIGPSLASTSGLTLGGVAVGSDGRWEPGADVAVPTSAGGVRLRVPAASAALVTLVPSSRLP
jgi:hypothetical protein